MKKIYSLLTLAALLAAGAACQSCSDMLDTESELVEYDSDRTLSQPSDTLYSVMGIVAKLQTIASRTLILGDVRADLVATTANASTDLQQLADFEATATNKYNRISDYYAVINNCNAYLERVDDEATKRGKPIFEDEIAAVHSFRAWTYMQLALIYGEVPLILEPIMSESKATEAMNGPKVGLEQIASYFIDDLRPYMDTKMPNYGSIAGFNSRQFFYPVRVLMADLCLWTGRYTEAAQLYHDYLNYEDKEILPCQSGSSMWNDASFENLRDGYSPMRGNGVITSIPMESEAFYGTISDVYYLYNSDRDHNYYYFQLQPSKAMQAISQAQDYCLEAEVQGLKDTIYAPKQDLLKGDLYIGDLRYASNYSTRHVNQDAGSRYGADQQTINKVQNGNVCLLRSDIVWLRYAEALNQAGHPQAAMAVLKYGICDENDSTYLDSIEVETAGNLIQFNSQRFTKQTVRGIHSNGSGAAAASKLYCLPMPEDSLATRADTIAYQQPLVEDLIITELALEGAYEGMRFYDLMRIAMRRHNWAYLATPIANRGGVYNSAIFSKLNQGPKAWYLPIQ